MNTTIVPEDSGSLTLPSLRQLDWFDRLAKRSLHRFLHGLSEGQVTLVDGPERHTFGRATPEYPLTATVVVEDSRFYAMTMFGGTLGVGEAYMLGLWRCSALTDLIRIFTRNREVMVAMEGGWASLAVPFLRLVHRWRSNTREGSRRNIQAHYDLGNDFYRLFLDETLCYSAGYFEREDSTLYEASVAKMDRLCRKLLLGPGDHLLEIGTGWGALAIHAARHFGCRVTTTTISAEQFNLASQRVREAGLQERVTVLQRDYRELEGQYDKIVSVEMIEAVGHRFYDTFFGQCSRLLKRNGLMALQGIVIRDHLYERALRSVDFIQRHIFPGSCIPSQTALCQSIARATDMRPMHQEDFTPHYARTLAEWRDRFMHNLDSVRLLGFPERFIRMWEYYLCYCEGGFAERNIGVIQMVLAKPESRAEIPLGNLS